MLVRRACARLAPAQRLPLQRRAQPARRSMGRWFDRLLPEDDPATKEFKERERAIIKKKLGRSRFAEMLAAHKDKKYTATAELEPGTVLFPECMVADLGGESPGAEECDPATFFGQQRATLVTVGFQALGQKQLEAWLDAFHARARPRGLLEPASAHAAASPPSSSAPARQLLGAPALLNIVYLDGWFFSLMRSFFTASVRGGLAPAVAGMSGIVFSRSEKTADHFVERLGIHNRVLGHLFLVDSRGYIRWRAHGDPAPGEIDALLAATDTLLAIRPAGRGM